MRRLLLIFPSSEGSPIFPPTVPILLFPRVLLIDVVAVEAGWLGRWRNRQPPPPSFDVTDALKCAWSGAYQGESPSFSVHPLLSPCDPPSHSLPRTLEALQLTALAATPSSTCIRLEKWNDVLYILTEDGLNSELKEAEVERKGKIVNDK